MMRALETKLRQISRERPTDSRIETPRADTIKDSSFPVTEDFFYLHKGRTLAWRRPEKKKKSRRQKKPRVRVNQSSQWQFC